MDEKLEGYLKGQFLRLFHGFPEAEARMGVMLEIYHAGCLAQAEATLNILDSFINDFHTAEHLNEQETFAVSELRMLRRALADAAIVGKT